jgi:thymidylate synthase
VSNYPILDLSTNPTSGLGAYETLMQEIRYAGIEKGDRTGTGTRSSFGRQLRYDLRKGFPLITTKKVHFKSVAVELLWFLQGETTTRFLHEHGVSIWDEWAAPDTGELGPVYGKQWRDWVASDGNHIDQMKILVRTLRSNPDSRRMLVSAWNVGDLPDMALSPCHVMFQCYVADGSLSLQVYQRSADMFLGVPFNIASYALLTHMLAQQANLRAGELVWTGGDCHVYANHVDQVDEQLSRELIPFPQLVLHRAPSLFDYTLDHIELDGYEPHPAISAPVAV